MRADRTRVRGQTPERACRAPRRAACCGGSCRSMSWRYHAPHQEEKSAVTRWDAWHAKARVWAFARHDVGELRPGRRSPQIDAFAHERCAPAQRAADDGRIRHGSRVDVETSAAIERLSERIDALDVSLRGEM